MLNAETIKGAFDLTYMITIGTPIVALAIFWYKISNSQKELVVMVAKVLNRQLKNSEKTDLFYQQIENDVKAFKEDNARQHGLCSTHNRSIATIVSNQKAQEITQNYMKDLFDDIKQLQIATNEAIANNTGVLTRLLFMIEERK